MLEKNNVCFFGNTEIYKNLSLDFISDIYDVVILATGASEDKILNIKGENINGVIGSSKFVGWYNDNPEYSNLEPNLNSKNVIIIGNGNVALDCARILAALACTEAVISALRSATALSVVAYVPTASGPDVSHERATVFLYR